MKNLSLKKLITGSLIAAQLLSPVATLAQDIELSEEKPTVAEVTPNNTPNRLITTFNGDPSTQMGFNWYTTELAEDAKVWVSTNEDLSDALEFEATAEEVVNTYGERDENGYFIFADIEYDEEGEVVTDENGEPQVNGYYTDENVSGPEWTSGSAVGSMDLVEVTEYSYKAKAEGLEPNTTYYYQVGSEVGETSEVGTFTTAGEAGEEFTFVQYTDTQNAYWNEHVYNEAAFGADTVATALEETEADFVLHTGDVVEVAEVEDEWIDILEQSKESILQVPFAVAAGNHDEYALSYGDPQLTTKFNEHINVPAENDAVDGGSYYSFDYNGVHFVVANTNDNKESEDNSEGKALGQEQIDWIRNDVEEARANGAEWVVLSYHKPLYSKSYHSLQDTDVQLVREEFMELIDELDIDLALQGHDHVISRTKPLNYVSTDENFSNGVVDEAEITTEGDVEYYVNPQGTIFVLPNTGGTKEYDDIYAKGVEHIHTVRPKLDWMTQEDVDYYNNLFAFGGQPQESDAFETSHSNNRDSAVQNFAAYTVSGNELRVDIYQIEGNLHEGEERKVSIVHSFGITKGGETTKESTEEAASEEESTEEISEESASEESSEESEESAE
ncbi:metallophosphoesterase family protein [Aerococcaceae bacterium INB8]|uniref:Metallophosphoesterase family protein n=1 Tax=Ruoffia halotolerans TaxID=2748684 RepID=A0A839A4E2_9LACT|nr:metallophosphoesterase family protein [Ruoffia halotolerans]MBA5728781.1 metallophosphoesterase family protein [Ruoffia halotolerans]